MDPRPPPPPRAAGRHGRALIAVGVALLCGGGPPLAGRAAAAEASGSPGNTFTAVVGSILGHANAPFPGSDGKAHLVYEVWLTNAKPAPATLDRIEIVAADGGKVLKNLKGEALVAALHTLDAKPAGSAALPPNESRLLFVELGFPTIEAAPARILHRLSGSAAASPSARGATAVRYDLAPVDVSREPLPVLAAPLAGARWVAVNGCCGPGGAHRGAVQSINGRLWDSQRFAIDWMRFDELGRLVTGDPSDVRNWVSYGTPIQAVRDGVVI